MNIELAEQVYDWAMMARGARRTAKVPAFDMDIWIRNPGLIQDWDGEVPIERMREGSCKTSACIAGYVALITAPKGTTTNGMTLFLDGDLRHEEDMDDYAMHELDITEEQANDLFFSSDEDAPRILRAMIDEARSDHD